MPPNMQALAFVDLETTGATASCDRITEIGIVEVDADSVREWSTLVNPEIAIPGFIQTLTGINDDMVRDAPTFAEVAEEVLQRLQGRLFIAHNARFDYGFLKSEFSRAGHEFRSTVLCTVKLSRKLFPEHRKHNLDALIERHGLNANGRHRALADAQLIHQFWNQMSASHPADRLASLLKELTAQPTLPPHLDPGVVDTLPEGPGVYLFYDDNDTPLYVGKAKGIRKRVLTHFADERSSAKKKGMSQQVRRIEWIETSGEIGTLLKEAALVKELQPTHNRQQRRDKDFCAIALIDCGDGLMKPEIVDERDLDFDQQKNLYGLFQTAKQATTVLAKLAAAYKLCPAILGLEEVEDGQPCSAHRVNNCKGLCIGAEPPAAHTLRLLQCLAKLRLKPWPFAGPAYLKEGGAMIVVDHWCYLGSVRSEDELWPLLEQRRPPFDRESYRILSKMEAQLTPLPKLHESLMPEAKVSVSCTSL